MILPVSTTEKEGIYQGSKYLQFPVLVDQEELKLLFELLKPFYIFPLTHIDQGQAIDPNEFLAAYGSWVEKLKVGDLPNSGEIKRFLAAAITSEEDSCWKMAIPNGRYLVKMKSPCVQLQAHYFTYSDIDHVFRPMTMSEDAIYWGLYFSFPQVYQEPKTMKFLKANSSPNFKLFQIIRKWVRDQTRATPFIVDGKKMNVPIRLGKNCFSWIHQHSGLKRKGICVDAN